MTRPQPETPGGSWPWRPECQRSWLTADLVAMTLDVYGHVVPGQGQRAAAAFADLVEEGR